jgi:predicted dehydrogenase
VDTIRVGIIGAGFGARVQVAGFRLAPGMEVVGLACSSAERARAATATYGVPATDDYRRLLDRPEIDLVSVASPPMLHCEMVEAALARGKHVICEKPFASSVTQAEHMVRAAEAARVVHAVDFEFRYLAARQALKAMLADGFVGQPRLYVGLALSRHRVDPTGSIKPWSITREGLGGALGSVGIHFLDAATWLLGPIESVLARLETFVPRRQGRDGQMHPATTDDLVSVLLQFHQAAAGNVEVCATAGQPLSRLEVHGDRGSLMLEGHTRLRGGRDGGPLEDLPVGPEFEPAGRGAPAQPGVQQSELIGPFAELAARVAARIRGQDADVPTFADGLASQRVLQAVFDSADTGRRVSVAS